MGIVVSSAGLRSRRCKSRHSAIDVFLVPLAMDVERRYGERTRGEDLVHGLFAPIAIVGGVRDEALPERQLIHAQRLPPRARGADGEPGALGVIARRDPFGF